MKSNILKTSLLISAGAALEFYDFTIYGLFSYYMSSAFFPEELKHSGLNFIFTLLIFGIGYIARPLGGAFFGALGDKKGRKSAFSWSLLIMIISTIAIGILPTYTQIGILSPLLLLMFRVLQGISMGAELPISSVFIYEHSPINKVGFYSATLFGLSNLGLLLGNLVNFILTHFLPSHAIVDFGWRIPFLLGGILGLISFYIRFSLKETPEFSKIIPLTAPFRQLLKNSKKELIAAIAASTCYGISVNFGFVLLLSLVEKTFLVPSSEMALLNLVPTCLFCFLDSIIGKLIDKYKINLLKVMLLGAIQFVPSFSLVLYGYSHHLLVVGFIASLWMTISVSCFDSTIPNFLPSIFKTNNRASGAAFGYSIGLAISAVITTSINSIISINSNLYYLAPIVAATIYFINLSYLSIYKKPLLII